VRDLIGLLVLVLVFITVPSFAQTAAPKPPAPAPPIAAASEQHAPSPPFSQLEQVIVEDIQKKQQALQQEVNDFLAEVRKAHPGFMFMNGSLVPEPAPPKVEEKK